MKKAAGLVALLLALSPAAFGQDTIPIAPPPAAAPAAPPPPTDAVAQPPSGGTILTLRGLDKITGRPTNIVAPIGKPVRFATLIITARYCYSTPPSETPETAAFVQIQDQRPGQALQAIFSGWMYASSPGLNGMDHALYDVWVINCNSGGAVAPASPAVTASTAPVKVAAPDSSDKEQNTPMLPEDAGK